MKKVTMFVVVLAAAIFWNTGLLAHAGTDEGVEGRVVSETREYYEDGSCITIIVIAERQMKRGNDDAVSGSKRYIATDKSGNELWRFTVHGTFTVNPGVSATCTAASYSISITESAWKNESASAFSSGSQAIGDASFVRKLLGITLETESCHVVLTCDSNGNLT